MPKTTMNDHPLYRILLEQEARPARVTPLELIDGSSTSKIGAPGSLAAFIARKGSKALDDVRAAARGDQASADRLLARYGPSRARADAPALSDATYAQMVVEAPVFASIAYGGEALSKGIILPGDVDLVGFSFPYNGGRLADAGLTLVEYYQDGSTAILEGLVVQMVPPLTPAERAALVQVPVDERVRNVGSNLVCSHTTYFVATAAALFVMAGTALVVSAAVVAVMSGQGPTHLSDAELANLDPSASARKLLATRRRLLLERYQETGN